MKEVDIAIIMGSDSDLPQMEDGIRLLRDFGVPFIVEVSSAHRTPERTIQLIRDFEKVDGKVIIAAAGGAAHLPGVISAHTRLPVLGVPIPSALNGLDSLLAMVQMPGGIPTAVFGIGKSGAVNAALFALQILALARPELGEKLDTFREEQRLGVETKNRRLQKKVEDLRES
ncbi:MAG TPA: 5-(carboxyamino)imidazole ribonucleotide mutase [Candidatus Aminicenantes bacterium]|nr:5-(carboxyamino)imidazole ribonucleotide mutase [Candidatus Aminicenantes bacterium]